MYTIYIYIYLLNNLAAQLKHCKRTILEFNKKSQWHTIKKARTIECYHPFAYCSSKNILIHCESRTFLILHIQLRNLCFATNNSTQERTLPSPPLSSPLFSSALPSIPPNQATFGVYYVSCELWDTVDTQGWIVSSYRTASFCFVLFFSFNSLLCLAVVNSIKLFTWLNQNIRSYIKTVTWTTYHV